MMKAVCKAYQIIFVYVFEFEKMNLIYNFDFKSFRGND